jgi:sugar/nucleoside kinase (ribokinase family)
VAFSANSGISISCCRSPDGSARKAGCKVTAAPIVRVVDTTGAGDLYASGFLYGLTRALPLPICGEIGSLCAAEIISHFGARPEVDLSQLLAESGRT